MKRFYKNIRNKVIINVRRIVFGLEDRFPFLGRPLVVVWKILSGLQFLIKKETLKLRARLEYGNDKLDFDKICWANPQKIEETYYIPGGGFNKWRNYSRILGGDWDLSRQKFESLDVYRAFKQRFKEGKKWEETEFYQRILKQMSELGVTKWGCKNKDELDERFQKIESLFHEIEKEGYLSQKEVSSPAGWLEKLKDSPGILDEVSLAISREGNLLFIDGRHRLSIAKLLNLSRIPARIIVRHKKWMDFRKELISFSRDYQGGKLYQPLTHPDLQDIPAKRQDDRFEIIRKNLSVSGGTLLDIGANLGYFCHRFEDEGFDCYALEENRLCLYFLGKLKKAENRKFKIIPQSVFEYQKPKEIFFDVILALSVFHHFLERKETSLDFIKLLKRLKAKELFFEAHLPQEFRHRKFYQNYSPQQFVDFIIENSCFKKAELIAKGENGRPLFKLH